MKAYVQDAHANKQINTIGSFVEDGLSDTEIATNLLNLGFKNLAREDGVWSSSDIEGIREKFNLNTAEGFVIVKPKETANLNKILEVSVVDVQMPFSSMVIFMVKWAIASIPAMIILFILGVLAYTVVIAGLLKH